MLGAATPMSSWTPAWNALDTSALLSQSAAVGHALLTLKTAAIHLLTDVASKFEHTLWLHL